MRKVLSTAREIESFYKKDLEDLIKSFDISIKICIDEQVRFNENNTIWNIYLDNSDNPIHLSTPAYIDLEEFNKRILALIFEHSIKSLNNEEKIRMIDRSNDLIKITNIVNRYCFMDGSPIPVTFSDMFEIKTEEELQESTDVDLDEEFSDLETLQALASDIVINKYLEVILEEFNRINPAIINIYCINDNDIFIFRIERKVGDCETNEFILHREEICLDSIRETVTKKILEKSSTKEINEVLRKFGKMMDNLILDSYIDYTNPYIVRGRHYYCNDDYSKLYWNNFVLEVLEKYNREVVKNKTYVRNQIKKAGCFNPIERINLDDDIYEFTENTSEGYINPYGLVIVIMKDKVVVGMVSTMSNSYNGDSVDSVDFIYQVNIPYQISRFIPDYNNALDMIFLKMMRAIKLDQK